MNLTLGPLRFSPTLLPTLATLTLLALLLALGFWQLDRAAQKQSLLDDFDARVGAAPVALTALDPAAADSRFRRVRVAGRYDAANQLLLDNQVRDGRPGYHVYTPLRLGADDAAPALLVNRGWVAAGPARERLPDVGLTQTEVELEGRLDRPANPGLKLGDGGGGAAARPLRVQHIDYDVLGDAFGYPLLPAVLLLDAGAAQGFERDWPIDFGPMTPDRHRGYALQWFGLAAALLTIYGVMNLNRRTPADAANDNPRTDP